ncbi:MAG: 4-hydroxybutyrate CoA-transferase [Ferrovibrio sp.]|uniref:acetyl-CoA hydrolase/transferase family protein n=1 Tax=Ferrovibrio sp. TaxID=1917215 RepID=UPI002620C178|nr:acetyl-CoA hydrolase/transferase C-terminal domain-containing protein [Ferrovibrio sp.]MCW0234715.1 4-hydroxybutyrate CoA-transferase [Ferrovibrio sp.]
MLLQPDSLDFARWVKPGDTVVCGQGTAEPCSLTRRLVAQADALGPLRLFLGPVFSDSFPAEASAKLTFTGYCGIGRAAQLSRAGRLDILTSHYSQLAPQFASGRLPADVVLLQLAPPRHGRRHSLGLACDYTLAAARRARVVIAEVNGDVPWTHGGEIPADLRIDAFVAADQPPLELPSATIGETERQIAAHVSRFIPDGATLQLGIGSIPDAIMASLQDRRDLGLHSGMAGDSVCALIETGVITNARKAIDPGVSITGVLFGGRRLYDYADDNPAIRLAPSDYTHAPAVIGRLRDFMAINSAIEVDLTGQVNAEVVDGTYLGAVGGQLDFTRAANAVSGGRAIIALPATARGGSISRIVAQLGAGVVTTPRSDADLVVTECGVAELRGCTLAERARRMIAIAAPDWRDRLQQAAMPLLRAG